MGTCTSDSFPLWHGGGTGSLPAQPLAAEGLAGLLPGLVQQGGGWSLVSGPASFGEWDWATKAPLVLRVIFIFPGENLSLV